VPHVEFCYCHLTNFHGYDTLCEQRSLSQLNPMVPDVHGPKPAHMKSDMICHEFKMTANAGGTSTKSSINLYSNEAGETRMSCTKG